MDKLQVYEFFDFFHTLIPLRGGFHRDSLYADEYSEKGFDNIF